MEILFKIFGVIVIALFYIFSLTMILDFTLLPMISIKDDWVEIREGLKEIKSFSDYKKIKNILTTTWVLTFKLLFFFLLILIMIGLLDM